MTIDLRANVAPASRVLADGGFGTVAVRSADPIDPTAPIPQESH